MTTSHGYSKAIQPREMSFSFCHWNGKNFKKGQERNKCRCKRILLSVISAITKKYYIRGMKSNRFYPLFLILLLVTSFFSCTQKRIVKSTDNKYVTADVNILLELLVNMKKHSCGSIFVLSFKKLDQKIQIDYSDNGRRISAD